MVRIGGEETSSDSGDTAQRRAPSGRSSGNRMQTSSPMRRTRRRTTPTRSSINRVSGRTRTRTTVTTTTRRRGGANDSFDSDFGNSTSSEDDEDEEENEKRKKPIAKKKSVYRDPKLAHKKGEGPAPGESRMMAPPPKPSHKKRPRSEGAGGSADGLILGPPAERSRASFRQSTQTSGQEASERRKSLDAEAKKRAAARTSAKPGVELIRLTQDEILAEAAQTEIINKGEPQQEARINTAARIQQQQHSALTSAARIQQPTYSSTRQQHSLLTTHHSHHSHHSLLPFL